MRCDGRILKSGLPAEASTTLPTGLAKDMLVTEGALGAPPRLPSPPLDSFSLFARGDATGETSALEMAGSDGDIGAARSDAGVTFVLNGVVCCWLDASVEDVLLVLEMTSGGAAGVTVGGVGTRGGGAVAAGVGGT